MMKSLLFLPLAILFLIHGGDVKIESKEVLKPSGVLGSESPLSCLLYRTTHAWYCSKIDQKLWGPPVVIEEDVPLNLNHHECSKYVKEARGRSHHKSVTVVKGELLEDGQGGCKVGEEILMKDKRFLSHILVETVVLANVQFEKEDESRNVTKGIIPIRHPVEKKSIGDCSFKILMYIFVCFSFMSVSNYPQ